eukprot:CAMPEP_0178400190 /NCGR_PEP_ID=MMETSP0689_2-20121128/15663_1 /TAXON_ID=160604 /ORGANISM="Amphidinium massartii, Strain CS-259" /LENGTH=142 /DNA_ID=CAMNT_0020020981 /DNA_START=80 /DNA_END=508 /DNA_ORIENTATION=+
MRSVDLPTIPHVGERPNQKLAVQGMSDSGPATHTGVRPRHPVEKILLDGPRRDEQQEMMTKSVIYGSHAPLRAKMERELLSSFQRLPGLQSSLTGLETLLDKDDEIEFEDVFNLEANAPGSKAMGPNFGLHDVMEQRLNMKF